MNNDTHTVPATLAEGSNTSTTHSVGNLQPDFLGGNILIGYDENITLANGEKHAGRYALVDLEDILASHHEETFSSTVGFPVNSTGHNVNDRNYHTDTNAQKQVMDYAQNLDAERIITTSVNSSGTPIISKDGIVVSGNNRTMSIKLAAKRFPEKYEQYKQVLIKRLSRGGYGIDHKLAIALCNGERLVNRTVENPSNTFYDNKYISMKKPFLVRIDYDFAGYTTTEFAKYNQDTKKSENPVDRAIKLGAIFNENPNCREQVVYELSMYDTFSDFYSNYQSQNRLKRILIDCGIITEAQLSGYYDNGFTAAGKDLIESLAAGMILDKEPLQAANMEGVKNFRQILITSLPVLLKNNSLKEFSLRAAINEAVVLQKKVHSSKLSIFDFISQLSVFDSAPTRDGLALQQLLSLGKINFKKSIESYNYSVEDTQGASLFGEKPTGEEIFTKHILEKLDSKVIALLGRIDTNGLVASPTSISTHTEVVEQAASQLTGLGGLSSGYTTQSDAGTSTIHKISSHVASSTTSIDSITNGQFFKLNPNKILGTLKETTNRYKKPISVVVGSLSEALNKIQFYVPSNMKENVMVSVQKPELPSETSIGLENLAEAISKTKNAVVAQLVAQKRFNTGKDCGAVYCFEQALQDYNPEISKDEIECYVWYKWSQGDQLGGEWSKMFHYSYDNETFNRWLEQDIACFDGTSYVYAPIFYSGNLYEKISQLEQDGAAIIEHVGEAQFHKQLEALKSLTPKKLSVSDPNQSSRLKINPCSNFAKNYHIASLKDGVNFTQAQYGYEGNKYKRLGVGEVSKSLFAAFKEHVNKLQPNDFKNGATAYEVVNYFLENASLSNKDKDKKVETNNQRIKQRSQSEGLRLFALFLIEELSSIQQALIDFKWNQTYNGFKKIDYNKIPIAFEFAKFYSGDVTIRPEKREAVAFILNEGSGVIAYDVGVGKTYAAIFTIAQFMASDYCKRPLVVVPNQVYRQFISEIKGLLPNIKVNEYFNLGVEVKNKIADEGIAREVDEYSITVVTKDALELIGFTERTEAETLDQMFEILNQGKESDREMAALREKLRTLMGRGIAGSMYNIEDFGFDFLCCDEAHMLKKIFTAVKGTTYEETSRDGHDTAVKREKSPYKIQSGKPSAIGLKGFMLAQYIQRHNKGRNVLLLTATPFTNSPLEIYSMLALVGYNKLSKAGVNNLKEFFDTYVAVSNELVITAKMKPERKQVVMSFDNLVAMQQLIRRFVNYKTGEDVGVERPNKIVLPLINKNIDGIIVPLTEEERIETKLPMSAAQKRFMADVEQYMNDKIDLADLCRNEESMDFVEDEDALRSEGVELDENTLSTDEKVGVKILRGLSLARNIALSPHLYSCSHLGTPTYKDYVEHSPKLQYVMECIRSMKAYCQSRQWPIPGVIIYMDRGTDFFSLLKDYLMYELGYGKHEVGIVISGIAPKQKESIKNRFLGIGYHEQTGKNFELTDDKRMKVLIGSSTIKEGMNLQKRSAFIFNCFLDWNPTDVKQLEGRIWRFGNIYKNVFIINPLMENSIDSFIFQKLQEKTSRINEIFADNNHENTLKLEELNPAELKSALITDPFKIAESEIQMLGERLLDQIEAKKAMITAVDKFKEAYQFIKEGTEKMRMALIERQPNEQEHEIINGLDTKGLLKYQNKMLDENILDYTLSLTDNLRISMRIVAKAEESMLKANGLQVEQLNDYVTSIETQIEKMMEERIAATSQEAVRTMAEEIIEQRKRENYNSKSVMERVGEFEKLLPMLEARMEYGKNDKKVVPQAIVRPTYATLPPIDAAGIRLITEDAIAFMEEQISKQEATKTLHTDNNGLYTLERQSLHQQLIKEFTSNKPCQTTNPVAILTGGLPGSGKSTYLKKSPYKWINDTSKVIQIDADEVRSRLPEYKGWNANATHDETKDVVNLILDSIGTPCTHDLVYDGTMNKLKNYIPLIERLRKYGYQIYVLFVRVPFEVSKERVLGRYQHSGRFVPISIIEEAYAAGDNALNQIKEMVDGYIVVDGVTHELVEKGGRAIPQSREYKEITPAVEPISVLEVGDKVWHSSTIMADNYHAIIREIDSNHGMYGLQKFAAGADYPSGKLMYCKAEILSIAQKGWAADVEGKPVYTSYKDYLLDLTREKYTDKFPGQNFDRAGVEIKYNEILGERGSDRAYAMLEEVYISYIPVVAKSETFENLRRMKKEIAALTAPKPKFKIYDILEFSNPKKKKDKFVGRVMKIKVIMDKVYYSLHIAGEADEITHTLDEKHLTFVRSYNKERSEDKPVGEDKEKEMEIASSMAAAAKARIRIIKLKANTLAKKAA